MPQMILKSLRLIFVLLAVIFSFNSYATYQRSVNSEPSEPSQLKPTEDSAFMKSLKPHFVSTQHEGYAFVLDRFDANKPASQSFEKDCPQQYNSFKENIQRYYEKGLSTTALDDGNRDISRVLRKSNSVLEQIVLECEKIIYENYRVIDHLFNSSPSAYKSPKHSKLTKFYKYFDYDQARRVFMGGYDEASPEGIKQLHTRFSDLPERYDDFYRNCFFEAMKNRRESSYGDPFTEMKSHLYFGEKLKKLQSNGCFEKRTKFLAFLQDSAFQNLAQAPSRCENPQNSCVASLRNLVGFDNPQAKSFFQACTEEQGKTNECCLTDSECKHFPPAEVQKTYQSLLQPIVQGSGNKDICHSQSSETKTARSQLANKAIEICEQSADKCTEFCKNGLSHFKQEFLKCFSLPNLSSQTADSLHSNNACAGQIKEIQARFSLKARSYFPNQNISLESLSNTSSVDSLIAESCERPLREIQKNRAELHARVEGIWYDACNKNPANPEGSPSLSNIVKQVRQIRKDLKGPSDSDPDPDQQRFSSKNIPPGVGAYSSHSNNPWIGTETNPTGGNHRDNMDPQFFPPDPASDSVSAQESSVDKFFDSNTEEEEFKGPEDPLRFSTPSVSVGPGGVGSLANIDGDLFDSENGATAENRDREAKEFSGKSSRSPSSSGTFTNSSGSRGAKSSGFRGLRRNVARSIKKPLAKAYIALFGDSRKTVKNVFNIHGPEVDLIKRQKELILQFCRANDCGASKEELDDLEKRLKATK